MSQKKETLHDFLPMEWTDEKVSRFWDFTSHFPTHYFTYIVGDGILNFIKQKISKPEKVLDYGSGTGHFLNFLFQLNGKVSALEFSPTSRTHIDLTYGKQANFEKTILIDEVSAYANVFDFITCIEVVEHLSDEHLSNTFSVIYDMLKPGGICMITTPNEEDLDKNLVYCAHCNHYFHRWQHMRSWNRSSLPAYAQGKGFVVKEVYEINFADYQKGFQAAMFQLLRATRELLRMVIKGKKAVSKKPHLVCFFQKPA